MADACCICYPLSEPPSSSRGIVSFRHSLCDPLPPLEASHSPRPVCRKKHTLQPVEENHGLSVPVAEGNKMVVVNVGPSFTSSDLFTPFSSPRTTLPSIAQFVRPTYGCDNTWGALKTSYGGVGMDAEEMEKSGVGSTSRSHKHYCSGCVNRHVPPQPHNATSLQLSQCRPCDQLLPKPLLTNEVVKRQLTVELPGNNTYTSHLSKFAVFPSHLPTLQKHTTEVPVLTPRTMAALSSLHSGLYCRSTYTKDFKLEAEHPTTHQVANLPEKDIKWEGRDDNTYSYLAQSEKTCGCCNDGTCADSEGEVAVCSCNYEDEDTTPLDTVTEDSDKRLRDHMTGHMTITHLSELPYHFRRITSKYTRNTLLPCCVPRHLTRKPALLDTSVSPMSVDTFRKKEIAGVDTSNKLAPVSHNGATNLTSCLPHSDNNNTFLPCPYMGISKRPPQEKLPSLCPPSKSNVLLMNSMENSQSEIGLKQTTPTLVPTREVCEGVTVLPDVVTPRSKLRASILQRLGVRYKSEAHARFHSMYPDKPPDLRDSHICSKKINFYGYHASVFRGC